MSQESVVEVITKALVNAEFRGQLLSSPGAALSGYDLTEEEQASLSGMKEDAFDAFASEIEERVSKSVPTPLPVPPDVAEVAQVERAVKAIMFEEFPPGSLTPFAGR